MTHYCCVGQLKVLVWLTLMHHFMRVASIGSDSGGVSDAILNNKTGTYVNLAIKK